MEDVKKIAERVGKDMNKMLGVLQQNLAQIPDDKRGVVIDAQKDVNVVMKSLKNGDTESLEKLIKKYGNLHR